MSRKWRGVWDVFAVKSDPEKAKAAVEVDAGTRRGPWRIQEWAVDDYALQPKAWTFDGTDWRAA